MTSSELQQYSEPTPNGLKAVGPNEAGREISHRIRPPNGVSDADWIAIIEFAVQHYRATSGCGSPDKAALRAYDVDDTIPERTWMLIFEYSHNRENFLEALAVRGVIPLGRGLTARQSIALDILTDPNIPGSWATRLKKAGLSEKQFAQWMEHAAFANQFKAVAENRVNSIKPVVDTVLAQKAVNGELDAIKYFDKRVGRDPDKKQEMDGRRVVGIVLDAITRRLATIPDGQKVLQDIVEDIEFRMKVEGVN